jgi:hypothetical protein
MQPLRRTSYERGFLLFFPRFYTTFARARLMQGLSVNCAKMCKLKFPSNLSVFANNLQESCARFRSGEIFKEFREIIQIFAKIHSQLFLGRENFANIRQDLASS